MGAPRDLDRTGRESARRRAECEFGDRWPLVMGAYRQLARAAEGREARAAGQAWRAVAGALGEARAAAARAQRLHAALMLRALGPAPDWHAALLPAHLGRDLERARLDLERLLERARRAAGPAGGAEARGPGVLDLQPAPRRRRRSVRRDPESESRLRRGGAAPARVRRALLDAFLALAPGAVPGSPAAWAMAGIAIGLDDQCPPDAEGDRRWRDLRDEWRQALRRARAFRR